MKKGKISINAPVILGFSLLCVFAFFLSQQTNGQANSQFFSIYRSSLWDPSSYIRAFLHVLGYDTQSELLADLMLLLIIGPMIEEKHGSGTVAKTILFVALATSAVHCAVFPTAVLLGAKGVIYALYILASFTGERESGIPITFIIVAILYIGRQLRLGYYSQNDLYTMVYVVESVIGGLVGAIMAMRV